MKRKTADINLKKIIQNLNNSVTEPELIIEEVWLFGSMLTDKKNPGDIDIAIKGKVGADVFRNGPPSLCFRRLDSATARIRKGMKFVSIHFYEEIKRCGYKAKKIWPEECQS